ncbi:MAG TPA: hypothetical protein VK708_08690 [Bryobacteraceae bacterium]|jgi:hypothetical protein|nr:hypothetical protein [Bryobacteraceae bacterium]
MHDPFQTYANMGVPYNVQQTSGVNPLTGYNPLLAINPITGVPQTGQQGYGPYPAQNFINPQQFIHPQQLQVAALASQAAIQNPIVAALLANPLLAAGLQSQFAQQPHSLYSQFGQLGGSAFGQNIPTAGIGYPPAPQSWVGQPGQLGGVPGYGQIHPLIAQLTQRALQGQAFSPWGY